MPRHELNSRLSISHVGINGEVMDVTHAHSHSWTLGKSYGLRSLVGLNGEFMDVIHAQELWGSHTVLDPLIALNHNCAHCGLMWFTHTRYGIITRSSTLDAPTLNFRNTAISHMGKMGVSPLKLSPITCLFTSITSKPITCQAECAERLNIISRSWRHARQKRGQ